MTTTIEVHEDRISAVTRKIESALRHTTICAAALEGDADASSLASEIQETLESDVVALLIGVLSDLDCLALEPVPDESLLHRRASQGDRARATGA